jgi:hypothetical protein
MRTISSEEFIEEMENGALITDWDVIADAENNSMILSLTIQPAPRYVVTFTMGQPK